jgi:hypothetical protein
MPISAARVRTATGGGHSQVEFFGRDPKWTGRCRRRDDYGKNDAKAGFATTLPQ